MTRALAVLVAALALSPAARGAEPAAAPSAAQSGEARATIPVKGMHCGNCVNKVSEALRKVVGVKSVEVDLDREQAVVVFDQARASLKKLVKTIDAAGYRPGEPRLD